MISEYRIKEGPESPTIVTPVVLPYSGILKDVLPRFLTDAFEKSQREIEEFDQLMSKKISKIPCAKLRDIEVVIGIPFYTEISNITSVLVTLREVFQERRMKALICVMGTKDSIN